MCGVNLDTKEAFTDGIHADLTYPSTADMQWLLTRNGFMRDACDAPNDQFENQEFGLGSHPIYN